MDGEFIEVEERTVFFKAYTLFNGFKIGYIPQYADDRDDSAYFDGIVRYDTATDQPLGSYLPIDTVLKNPYSLSGGRFYFSGDQRLLFTQHHDYTIYEFDSLAVPHALYKVVLPLANTIPADFLTNPAYHGKWRDYLHANRSLIYSIRDVYVSGDWLTFYTAPSIKSSAFLYNLATYELFNLKETKDSVLGLPITENLQPVLGTTDGALISEVPFLSLKKLYEETPSSQRSTVFPHQLLKLMKKESYNPILRLSYLKQQSETK